MWRHFIYHISLSCLIFLSSICSLGDLFVILAPVVEDLFQQLGNGTGEFENSLNLVFSFLRTVFESNKVPLTDGMYQSQSSPHVHVHVIDRFMSVSCPIFYHGTCTVNRIIDTLTTFCNFFSMWILLLLCVLLYVLKQTLKELFVFVQSSLNVEV